MRHFPFRTLLTYFAVLRLPYFPLPAFAATALQPEVTRCERLRYASRTLRQAQRAIASVVLGYPFWPLPVVPDLPVAACQTNDVVYYFE